MKIPTMLVRYFCNEIGLQQVISLLDAGKAGDPQAEGQVNNHAFLTTSMIQSVGNLLRKTDQMQELLVWVLHQGLEDLFVIDDTLNFLKIWIFECWILFGEEKMMAGLLPATLSLNSFRSCSQSSHSLRASKLMSQPLSEDCELRLYRKLASTSSFSISSWLGSSPKWWVFWPKDGTSPKYSQKRFRFRNSSHFAFSPVDSSCDPNLIPPETLEVTCPTFNTELFTSQKGHVANNLAGARKPPFYFQLKTKKALAHPGANIQNRKHSILLMDSWKDPHNP